MRRCKCQPTLHQHQKHQMFHVVQNQHVHDETVSIWQHARRYIPKTGMA